MTDTLIATTFKDSNQSFLTTLDEHGIKYNRHSAIAAEPMAAGFTIEIILAGGWGAVAVACLAWAYGRKSRRINVTTKNNESIWLEGYSADDAAKILETAKKIAIIDTEKDNDKT